MTHFTNPILAGYYPDPSVLRVGDTFYLVNSSFEHFPGLPIHASTDLVNWRLVTHAVSRTEQFDYTNIRPSGGLYAPTLREHNGTFYIVCTFVDGPEGAEGNFILSAPSPEGPWSDPTFVDFPGIDPSLFFEDDRAWWLGCADAEPYLYEGHKSAWLQEINVATGGFVGERHQLWSGALRDSIWCEGPHLYAKDGWYYLLTAEGGTEFNHAVTVARSRAITGPYVGHARNPVLTHRHLGEAAPVQNVGHAEIFDDQAGNWWAVTLGTRPVAGGHVLGRETFLAPVSWEDDWPVFSPGAGMLPSGGETNLDSAVHELIPGHVGDGNLLAHALTTVANGSVEVSKLVSLRANWLEATSASARKGSLLLRSNTAGLDSCEVHTFVASRFADHHSTMNLKMRVSVDSLPAAAASGLALVQNNTHHLFVGLTKDKTGQAFLTVSETIAGAHHVAASSQPLAQTQSEASSVIELDLTAQLSGSHVKLTARAGEIVVNKALTAAALTTEVAGGFVGTVAGPYTQGNKEFETLVDHWTISREPR